MYEYLCQDCSRQFEAFVTKDRAPECPTCHGTQLRKLLSSPGMVGTAAREAGAFPSCGAGCGCHHRSAN